MQKGTEGVDTSIQFFIQAIALDPAYGPSYSGLSSSYGYLAIFGLRPSGEVYPKAKAAAMRSVVSSPAPASRR